MNWSDVGEIEELFQPEFTVLEFLHTSGGGFQSFQMHSGRVIYLFIYLV